MADYEIAAAKKDADRTLELLGKILETMGEPWELSKSRLYYKLAEQKENSGQQTEIFKRMRTGLLTELEKSEEFAFVRDRQEFTELIEKLRRDGGPA